MRELSRMVYPSFYFYQIRFPTELRAFGGNYSVTFTCFWDTCSSTIVVRRCFKYGYGNVITRTMKTFTSHLETAFPMK